MIGVGRLKDLGDAQEMTILFNLPQNYAEQLNPYVRDRYDELWQTAQPDPDQEPQG